MRKLIALLVGLLFLVTSAPGAAAADLSFLQPAAAPPLRITLVSTDGTPLPEAEIHVLRPGVPGIAVARTNQHGQAMMTLPAGYSYWIRVWADGHALIERAYLPAADGSALTLVAEPYTALLTGVVRDQRGLPVSGAKVSLYRSGFGLEATATTNDTGIYTLPRLTLHGEYTLQVEAAGFRPVSQPVGQLAPSRRNQVDLTLTPAQARVTGEVVGNNARPVGGVLVELVLGGWGPVARTSTDSSGYFSLGAPALNDGVYRLRLSRASHETVTTAPFSLSDGGWVDFSGADRLVINPLYAQISGKLFDGSANPLDDVEVHLQRQGLGTVEVARTDEEGRFAFAEVPAGTYRVRAFPDGNLTHADTGWLEVTGGQAVTANIVATSPDLFDHGFANLSGTVRNHLDEPVEGAQVVVYRGSQSWKAVTDAEGRYDLSLEANVSNTVGAESGTGYHVVVSADGYLMNDQPVTQGDATASLVDIRADADNQANFVLQPERADFAGRVVDGRGLPIAGVQVGLQQEGRGLLRAAETDQDGRFRFADLPIAKQSRYLPVIVDTEYVNGSIGPDGDPIEPAALLASDAASVTLVGYPDQTLFLGLVQAGDDRPAESTVVTVARPSDGREFITAVAEDGSYQVRVPAAPGEQYLVRARGSDAPLAATAEVVDPGTLLGVQVNLTTHVPAAISGRVLGPDGLPWAGARVMLYAEGSATVDKIVVTDAAGYYRFANLVPGRRYGVVAFDGWNEMSAMAPGEVVITPLVNLPSGETVWADIQLSRLPAVTAP